MAIVKAGKFMMRIITWVMVTGDNYGKGVDPDEARKRVFKGITGVEGTRKEFKKINAMLRKYRVFKPFDLEDNEKKTIGGMVLQKTLTDKEAQMVFTGAGPKKKGKPFGKPNKKKQFKRGYNNLAAFGITTEMTIAEAIENAVD